jgi:hypothetical protein
MRALEDMSSEDDSQEANGTSPEQQQTDAGALSDDPDTNTDLEPTVSSPIASEASPCHLHPQYLIFLSFAIVFLYCCL